jgi:peptidoglycan/LPS O-acetylase OafA/YrhL
MSGVILCTCALYKQKIAFGSSWSSLPAGLARTIFSFSLGLIVHHLHKAGSLRVNVGSAGLMAAVIVLTASLLIPVNPAIRGIYDLAFVALISPILIAIGTSNRLDKRLVGLSSFLGTTSYALYAIHYTTINIFHAFAFKLFDKPAVFFISMLGVALLLGVSYAVDRWYDRPIRRALMAKIHQTNFAAETLSPARVIVNS